MKISLARVKVFAPQSNVLSKYWFWMIFFLVNAFALEVEEMDEDQDEQLTVAELTRWIEKRQREQVRRF